MTESNNELNQLDKIGQSENLIQDSKSDRFSQLESENLFNDSKRGEQYRKHIYWIVSKGLYVGGFIIVCLILIWAFHIMSPLCWRWLDPSEIHTIERIIFSGVILSLASGYFKKFNIIQK